MRHPSIKELFDYWNHRRGRRAAPDRADIEPGAIRSVLADTFILSFDERSGHPFRIAGTRVCAAFGRELKNDPFLDLWDAESRAQVRDLLNVVTNETVGVVASARGTSTAQHHARCRAAGAAAEPSRAHQCPRPGWAGAARRRVLARRLHARQSDARDAALSRYRRRARAADRRRRCARRDGSVTASSSMTAARRDYRARLEPRWLTRR